MRPTYETQGDVSREQACAQRVADALGCSLVKLTGQYSRLDRLATWPTGRHAWLEIKCRAVKHDAYPTLLLSAAKWREGMSMAQATGGWWMIVASYLDADRVYVFQPEHLAAGLLRVEYGGRTVNTRDAGDIEPVIHVPRGLFVPLAR